jgi:NAD(P)-dependent dehydrogenase (short-subunit alcohol dehydrogenase family)
VTVNIELSPYQRKVWYWLDAKLQNTPSRGIAISHTSIAQHFALDRRRVVAVMQALQEKGALKRSYRLEDNGKYAANDYLVMPCNPRKFDAIQAMAIVTRHDPFDVLIWCAKIADLFETMGEKTVYEMTMQELATIIGYRKSYPQDGVGVLIDAAREHGIDLAKRMAQW